MKPSYKDHWSIPGGVVDKDESPRSACVREVGEEIGLQIRSPKFLSVDWVPPSSEKGESLQFIFFAGVIGVKQIKKIRLAGKEISEYRFLPVEEALVLFNPNLKKRLAVSRSFKALKNNTALYLEDGR